MDDNSYSLPSNPLRIAFCLPEQNLLDQVTSNRQDDASNIQQEYIAAGLRARRHKLTLIAPNYLNEVLCARNLLKPQLVPRTWSRRIWFRTASKGIWKIQQWLHVPYLNVFSNYCLYDAYLQCLPGHDLVQERNSLYRAGVAMACKRLKLPYILFFDADEILEHDLMGKPITGLLRQRAKYLIRYNLRAANCVICVSESAKVHLITTWNVPAGKIVVFLNGVDIQRFRPYPETVFETRASLRLGMNPLIIFVGNFYEWHDVKTLLDAFAKVLVVYPDARLVLVGDGSLRRAMVQYAVDVGVSHAVHFTGLIAHSEVPRLVAAADIAVAPYPIMKHEFWMSPMKLFEYMASGKAIIASRVGQIADVIIDGNNGLLVSPGDASALEVALKGLIGDPTLRSRLGHQARVGAVRHHSWQDYSSRLEHLYLNVIASRSVNLI